VTSVEETWALVRCTYCGASPHQGCKGPNGKPARSTHSARVLLAKATFQEENR